MHFLMAKMLLLEQAAAEDKSLGGHGAGSHNGSASVPSSEAAQQLRENTCGSLLHHLQPLAHLSG